MSGTFQDMSQGRRIEVEGQTGTHPLGVSHVPLDSGADVSREPDGGNAACDAAAEPAAVVAHLVGTPIEIREVGGAFVAVPVDRAHLRSPTWAALRAGPRSGIGRTPEEAALLLAHAAGVSTGGARRPATPRAADRWLQEALQRAGGIVLVSDVVQAARAAGIASETLRRAATRLGVVRKELGLQGGWSWTLPAEAGADANNATASIEGGTTTFVIEAGAAGKEQTR